jgi:hypothetical protein
MPKLREYIPGDEHLIRHAIGHLKSARDLLTQLGAKKTLIKVRSALKGAEGAERHVNRIKNEHEREEARARKEKEAAGG